MPKRTDFSEIGASIQKAASQKTHIPNVQPEAPRNNTPGRRCRYTVGKKNGITVYFDDDTYHAINEVKFNNRLERTRIIQTAVHEFMKAHYNEAKGGLDEEGYRMVEEYERTITIDNER